MSKLSENLKILRANRELTQEDLAQHLEISRPAYNRYEQAGAEPNIKNLIKLADFYSLSIDELVGREFKQDSEPMKKLLLKKQIDSEIKGIIKEVIKEIVEQREIEIKAEVYKRFGVE